MSKMSSVVPSDRKRKEMTDTEIEEISFKCRRKHFYWKGRG